MAGVVKVGNRTFVVAEVTATEKTPVIEEKSYFSHPPKEIYVSPTIMDCFLCISPVGAIGSIICLGFSAKFVSDEEKGYIGSLVISSIATAFFIGILSWGCYKKCC